MSFALLNWCLVSSLTMLAEVKKLVADMLLSWLSLLCVSCSHGALDLW